MFKKTKLLTGIMLASAAYTSNVPYVLAQDNNADENDIETLIVTGTRSATRTAFSSLAPIDVISGKDIDSSASEDLLDTLAQSVPSFKVQRLPMADGLIFVRPATLRSLSPDHTLVLINGKRRHRSALLGRNGAQGPDMATIPSSSIKRVEVLRDGASAQYGSDAIGGVINIILDDKSGFRAFAQGGEYQEGDGDNMRFGLQAGTNIGDDGFLTATLEYFDADRTVRARQRPDAIAFKEANPTIAIADPVQRWGQPEANATRFAWNAQMGLSDTADAYVFGTYNEGEGLSDFNWRNPLSGVFRTSAVFPNFDLRSIYPGGFSPQFGQNDEDLSIAGGIKGELMNGDLSWDLSIGHGRNTIEYFISNTINASLGPNSPTSFKPGELEQRELNLNLDFSYQMEIEGLNAPANIAFGLERREETYEIRQGDAASYAIGPGAPDGLATGSNGFRGFGPQQAGEFEQESFGAYVDVELPLTEAWTVGIAGRYEDFDHFGDTWNGKISTRYAITEGLAFRATASTGFRAPTPAQLFSEATSQGLDTVTLEVFTRGRFSPEGPVAAIIAARPDTEIDALASEQSTNMTMGFTYRNDAGFTASVDMYQIEIEDRFGQSSNFVLTGAEKASLAAANVPGANTFSSVSFYQNDFDTKTTGVDVVASYTMDAGNGVLGVTASYNYNKTEVTDGNFSENARAVTVFEERLPQHSANLSANYEIGDFEVLGRLRYYGEWTDNSGNANGEIYQKFDAESFIDLAVTYHFNEHVDLKLGAENVFDTYPDEATFQKNRGLIYSRNAPYDTDGGFYYLRAAYEF